MGKPVSCGIAPIRKNGDDVEILLCKPIYTDFYGMGFLKGQVEENETNIEAAKREFNEESGGLDVELIDEDTYFVQNNPKKKIYIWPAKVSLTKNNVHKITSMGIIPEHDDENVLIKFYPINDLPDVFRNQQQILDDLLQFIEKNKDNMDVIR
jgi:ADP-ribose pyrophosphatase YjhB (NUDIX family)